MALEQPLSVLAVDPAPSILALYRTLLDRAGYRTTTLDFAAVDLDTIAALRPDLLLIDGPWDRYGSGWEFLAQLRANATTRATPILVSTFAGRQFARRASETAAMGGVSLLHKPFDEDGLLAAVAATIVRSSSAQLTGNTR